MVRYSVHGEMVVQYPVHRWVEPLFVHEGEVAVSVVRQAVEAAGRDLLLISLMMSWHWQNVYPSWEEEEEVL